MAGTTFRGSFRGTPLLFHELQDPTDHVVHHEGHGVPSESVVMVREGSIECPHLIEE